MKTYLEFSVDGDITEIKTKNKSFDANDYINDYKFVENINYNKYIFILLYNNSDNNNQKNITKLPFYNRDLYGKFIIFMLDSENNIKSFTENKFLNLITVKKNQIEDYSSDDFNLSD